ncbi:replication-associated recombination protein A [Erysipelothrix sp. HDW6C]|uniref:replication-associated recombination protein A n=1 Tax=Erysipelothrix sp. HDW6C TaxID=2714930 RepID=UPI00140CE17F|nr:replication-associated recombination protein A [Erysipelothrix sp. HDW6C]QIK69014.1 replication-associated recombination protein A [Erysipelothrix sp. HDW6C]
MNKPLAYKVRPETIDDIIGQDHLLGPNHILRNLVENKELPSMIFFGPPGTGKTTTAMAIANSLGRPFRLFNAVTDNKKKLDQLFVEAEMSRGLVVIIDEVHRLNKDKQDILLPHVESGLITMIGATTANPYFSINPAIRSRVHLFEFQPLTEDNLIAVLNRAIDSYESAYIIDTDIVETIARSANGDARYALNALDLLTKSTHDKHLTMDHLSVLSLSMNITMDKDSDNYYDALSAFQKSIRGSDVNAALYYLAKLITVGDFDSIERRLIATVYEDIGLANPSLCARVVTALEGARKIGFPEARLPISSVVIECALSPKSKSAEAGIDAALQTVTKTAHQVPKYLRLNAVGVEDEDMYDYGRSDLWHKIQYLPDELRNEVFYQPQNLNSAEKTYAGNDEALKKYKRSNNLRALKKNSSR